MGGRGAPEASEPRGPGRPHPRASVTPEAPESRETRTPVPARFILVRVLKAAQAKAWTDACQRSRTPGIDQGSLQNGTALPPTLQFPLSSRIQYRELHVKGSALRHSVESIVLDTDSCNIRHAVDRLVLDTALCE